MNDEKLVEYYEYFNQYFNKKEELTEEQKIDLVERCIIRCLSNKNKTDYFKKHSKYLIALSFYCDFKYKMERNKTKVERIKAKEYNEILLADTIIDNIDEKIIDKIEFQKMIKKNIRRINQTDMKCLNARMLGYTYKGMEGIVNLSHSNSNFRVNKSFKILIGECYNRRKYELTEDHLKFLSLLEELLNDY